MQVERRKVQTSEGPEGRQIVATGVSPWLRLCIIQSPGGGGTG